MKSSLKTTLGAIALLAVSSSIYAAATIERTLQAKYDTVCAVMKTNNWEKIEKTLKAMGTKDFTTQEIGQQPMNAEKSMEMMKTQFSLIKEVKTCTMAVKSAKQTGNKATAMVSYKMVMITKPGQDKKTHTIEVTGTTQDDWEKIGNNWMMKSMKTLTENQKMDGKAIGAGR